MSSSSPAAFADSGLRRPAQPGAAQQQASRKWWWVLAALLTLALLLALAFSALLDAMHAANWSYPLSVVVDGERVIDGVDIGKLPPGHQVGLVIALLVAALVAVVLLPLALILLAGGLLALLLVVLGVPVLAVLVVLAVVLSPLLLLGWLAVKFLS